MPGMGMPATGVTSFFKHYDQVVEQPVRIAVLYSGAMRTLSTCNASPLTSMLENTTATATMRSTQKLARTPRRLGGSVKKSAYFVWKKISMAPRPFFSSS